MGYIFIIFFRAWNLFFRMWNITRGCFRMWNIFACPRTSSQYDMLLCSESLVSFTFLSCRLPDLVTLFLLHRDRITRPLWLAAYVRDGYGAFRQHKFECDCLEMLLFRVCGNRQNFDVLCLDDRIINWLLTSMAAVQANDVRAAILFVNDLNCHHHEWLGSKTPNRHGVAAFDLCPIVIKWLLAQPINVVVLCTS